MADVILKPGEQGRIIKGDPWVYDNEIDAIDGSYQPGDIVDVYDFKRRFIGRGYINPKSRITVRIMTYRQEEIDRGFFYKRIAAAWAYRQRFVDTSCCRVIFAEADMLPALIVDKFGDYLVVQTLALGIDRFKDTIVDVLDEIIQPKGIYERNDVQVRELEGLDQRKGFLKGRFDTVVEIVENGIRMLVDIENGQKTGYFLDQRENRAAIAPLVKGADVLDCFCHTGAFAMHACRYGACHVTAVDISDEAIEYARRNAGLNGFDDRMDYVVGNTFDVLKDYQKAGRSFDVVILDPPAFAKSKKALPGAQRGYKDINLRAMKIIKPGGFLVTCSCSHYMYPEMFQQVIQSAAEDAGKLLRMVEFRTQAKDHPYLISYPESLYLKFGIYQVLDR